MSRRPGYNDQSAKLDEIEDLHIFSSLPNLALVRSKMVLSDLTFLMPSLTRLELTGSLLPIVTHLVIKNNLCEYRFQFKSKHIFSPTEVISRILIRLILSRKIITPEFLSRSVLLLFSLYTLDCSPQLTRGLTSIMIASEL